MSELHTEQMQQIAPDLESAQFERCEECHAPVDRDQRYCVNCGAHRRHVPDPAAKYLSRVSARPGAGVVAGTSSPGTALVRSTGPARRGVGGIGLLSALALALIPVAAAIGIAIGRSSNSQDSKLIRALESQRAQTTTTLLGSGASASAPSSSGSTAGKNSSRKHAKKGAAKKHTTTTAASRSTGNGPVAKVTGTKVTASEQQQGSTEAKKVQNSTGKSYVQADNNLPSSVVVGP